MPEEVIVDQLIRGSKCTRDVIKTIPHVHVRTRTNHLGERKIKATREEEREKTLGFQRRTEFKNSDRLLYIEYANNTRKYRWSHFDKAYRFPRSLSSCSRKLFRGIARDFISNSRLYFRYVRGSVIMRIAARVLRQSISHRCESRSVEAGEEKYAGADRFVAEMEGRKKARAAPGAFARR